MVRYNTVFLLLLLTISKMSYAAGFSSRAEQGANGENESINLRLELSDIQATAPPDLSEVEKSFQVLGSQSSSISRIINGASSFSTVWTFALAPTQTGQTSIPPVSIMTENGELKTRPVPIQVGQHSSARPSVSAEKSISFIGRANKVELYKNEPVLITYRLTSNRTLGNIQLGDFSIKDAILEQQGQPKIQTEIVSGHERQVLLISYLVTPMKDGILAIPPLTIHGTVLAPRASVSNGRAHSILGFEDDEDPVAEMRKMMSGMMADTDLLTGFSGLKPVTFVSNPINLEIRPSVAGMDPWLPASALKISEVWSGDQFRVGDPITRTIITEASGLSASQLPGFENQLSTNNDFKVYSDQPQTSTKWDHGQIVGVRKDVFTLIPQKEGDIQLPAVKLTWWDTHNHLKKVASISERIVHVLPGVPSSGPAMIPTSMTPGGAKSLLVQAAPATSQATSSRLNIWLIMYALLAVSSISIIVLIIKYILRIKKETTYPCPPELTAIKALGKSDLLKCKSVGEVHQFLQRYSQTQWGVPANLSLNKLFAAAELKIRGFDPIKAKNISTQIEEALYSNQPVKIEKLQREIADFIFQKSLVPKTVRKQDCLPDLNPG